MIPRKLYLISLAGCILTLKGSKSIYFKFFSLLVSVYCIFKKKLLQMMFWVVFSSRIPHHQSSIIDFQSAGATGGGAEQLQMDEVCKG